MKKTNFDNSGKSANKTIKKFLISIVLLSVFVAGALSFMPYQGLTASAAIEPTSAMLSNMTITCTGSNHASRAAGYSGTGTFIDNGCLNYKANSLYTATLTATELFYEQN